jgi:transcriptional regulator with PAS, ATPase and Fis domain
LVPSFPEEDIWTAVPESDRFAGAHQRRGRLSATCETGSGKERVAVLFHAHSRRQSKPFVMVD